MTLEQHLTDLFDASLNLLSDIKPSDWAAANRVMSSSESRWEGRFDYSLTPYCIEIINRFSPDDPARIIACMKGAQLGISKGVLENLVGYYISEHPCNILHLTGHADLAEEGTENIDLMIDGCGLRHLIRDSKINSRKTGDTAKRKLFMGGKYISGSVTNHKLLAQRSIKLTLVDDYDKGKQSSKESGSTRKLIEQRSASFGGIGKIGFFSTPELRPSNIEEVFLLGDQRYYNVPCPCCAAMIPLKWSVIINNTDGKEKGGLTWKLDSGGKLIKESVGYICQECAGFFTDKHKYEMNLAGVWMPTAIPSQEGYLSYHISSLYAPVGMFDWAHYIRDYIEANPPEGQKEHLQKTLVNLCWGEPFEQQGKAPKGNDLQKNTRNYEIGTIPERLSINDGNGEFVLLTCGADMNGVVDDARLDYEVVGWTESGSSYSITHGSIGTFIPRENSMKVKVDRERWTYEFNSPRSVWGEFAKVLNTLYQKDTGKRMGITYAGLDTGHYTNFAYTFIDTCNLPVVGLKGKDADKYIAIQKDIQSFHYAKERSKLFLVEVNYLKDRLAENMVLRWKDGDGPQPAGFMNFPQPGKGLYGWSNFFEHYESEHWVVDNKDGQIVGAKWEKKTSVSQNHLWDCFDEKTEVLTEDGWKFFSELNEKQKLATVNLLTDELEYQKPLALIQKEYTGQMISIDGKRVNAMITPEHRMVVYRKKWNPKTNSGRMLDTPEIVLAKDLRATDTIKLGCKWNATGDKYYIIPENIGTNGRINAPERKIDSETWASFLGIFVSDGSKSRNWNKKSKSWQHTVKIHQNLGVKFDEIKEILDSMPFTYHVAKQKGIQRTFVISQKQLYNELIQNGKNCYTKRSGEWVKKQSVETINKFLHFAILGDGYVNPSFGNHRKYYTTNKLLADDIQELFIKSGSQGNISHVQPKDCKLNTSNVCNTVLQYHVSENKTTRASLRQKNNELNFKSVEFSGMVYCATVPNGTLICRREGKSFIAGNCRVYTMASRDIFVQMVLDQFKVKHGTYADFVKIIMGTATEINSKGVK